MTPPTEPTAHGIPSRFASDTVPSEAFSRIMTAIEVTPASTFGPRTRIVIAALAVPLWAIAIVFAGSYLAGERAMVRFDLAEDPTVHLQLLLCGLVGLTLATSCAALMRGKLGMGVPSRLLALTTIFVAPIYAALAWAGAGAGAGAAIEAPNVVSVEMISPWGRRCLIIASLVGLFALVSFGLALQRAAPIARGLRGAAIGASAGAWAGLSVFVFCPAGEHLHLIVGHVLPIVIMTLLGAIALPHALRP